MANFVDFDLSVPPRKRRLEVEIPKTAPALEQGNEWTFVTPKKKSTTLPHLPPPQSLVKKYTYLSESEVKFVLDAHMKASNANMAKMAYLERKTPTELATEMVGKKGFSLATIKKFYRIFRTETPL